MKKTIIRFISIISTFLVMIASIVALVFYINYKNLSKDIERGTVYLTPEKQVEALTTKGDYQSAIIALAPWIIIGCLASGSITIYCVADSISETKNRDNRRIK